MNRKIKLMLVEDNESYRKVISRALSRAPDMELISQFGTAEIALRHQQDLSTRKVPDVLLLDLNLPGLSGLEALPYFSRTLRDAKIIILTQSDKEADILSAIQQGAAGYLLKSSTSQQIKDGIHLVMNGGATLDAKVAGLILNTLKKAPPKEILEKSLTKQEHTILVLLGDGFVQKEIASKLDITRNTVAHHIKNIYLKLDVCNAPAAISTAYRLGIFTP